MKHIPIKHPDGDISLDKLRESYLQSTDLNKDFKILDALINKIVEQDSIIQQYEFTMNKINNMLDNCWEAKSRIVNKFPEINTSKGQYVVALISDCVFEQQYLTRDKIYLYVKDEIIIDDQGEETYARNQSMFRQATEEEIKTYLFINKNV